MRLFSIIFSTVVLCLVVSCESPVMNSSSPGDLVGSRAVYTDFSPDSNPAVRAVIKSDIPYFTTSAGNLAPVFNADPAVNAIQFVNIPNPPVNSIATSEFSFVIDLDSNALTSDYYRVYANLDVQLESGNSFLIFVNGVLRQSYQGDGTLHSPMLNAYVSKSHTQADNGHTYTVITFRAVRAYRSLDPNAANTVTMRAVTLRNVAKLQTYSNLPTLSQHFLVYRNADSWATWHAQYGWNRGWDVGYIPLVTTASDLVQFHCYYYPSQTDFVYRPTLNDSLYSSYFSDQTEGLWFFNIGVAANDPNDQGKATLSEYFSSSQYEHVYSTDVNFHTINPQFDKGWAVAKVYLLSDQEW